MFAGLDSYQRITPLAESDITVNFRVTGAFLLTEVLEVCDTDPERVTRVRRRRLDGGPGKSRYPLNNTPGAFLDCSGSTFPFIEGEVSLSQSPV